MQRNQRLKNLAVGAVLLVWAGAGHAQENVFDLSMPAQTYVKNAGSFMLAANETGVLVKKEAATAPSIAKQEYEPPLLSGSNTHLALGLGTIAAAVATAVTAPEGCEHNCGPTTPPRDVNGTHAKLAKATVALAAATIASGLIVHWDDFHFEDGFSDPDNLHALLGISGAALMAYAVDKSAKSSVPVEHAGLAELGALGMVAAIKLTW
ncbi:MAG: hypothetical protein PXX77_00225 [Gallionella sp.]|nr:hypothetical protein [Gallionella sp.]